MKIKTLLSVLFSTLFAVVAIAQAPNNFQMNKNKAIQFYNSADALDGTEIIRQGGNSLRIKYLGSNFTFDALDDKLILIRNSTNVPNIQLHPNGGKSFILGKLAVGADDSAIPAGFNFFVNGDIKATEVNAAFALENAQKIRFKNAVAAFDGAEILRTTSNSLVFRYLGAPLRVEAKDDQPFQIRNSLNDLKVQLHPNEGNSFILGKLGLGITSPQVLLDLNLPDADPKAIRFRRTSHPTYELRLASSKGLSVLNAQSQKYEMVFGGDGTVGIGENFSPQAYLHITQAPDKPYGIKLSRDEGVHTDYELFIGSSQGLNIKNSETGDIDMVFGGDKTVGIGTLVPTSPLHIKQYDERGLRLERPGHDLYDIGVKGSKGLHVTNVTDVRQEMVFDGSGKIGIGTDAPSGVLHVVGDPNINDAGLTSPGGFLVLGNTTGPNLALDNNEIMARDNGAISNLGLQADGGSITVHGGSAIPESEKVHISGSGNVGIGTISPNGALEIKNNVPLVVLNDANSGDGVPRIETRGEDVLIFNGFSNVNNQTYRFYPFYSDTRNSDAVIDIMGKGTSDFTHKLSLTHNGENGLISTGTGSLILSPNSGNVGIGTTSPEHKLQILNGAIGIQPDGGGGKVMQFKTGAGDSLNFAYRWENNAINYNIDPKPATSDGGAQIRFFRQTNTTGNKSVVFFRGDHTADASAVIGVDGYTSYFQAHGGNVGIGTKNPAASAALDIQSTDKGVLVPRLTTAQRTAISSPATGLLVYDTDLQSFFFHNGTSWTQFIAGSNNDADADPNNELQTISKTGNTVTLSNGGGTFTDEVNDADANPTNEYNTSVNLSGNTLNIVDGGGSKSVDLSSLITVEADPQVGTFTTTNYLPKWNGSALVQSTSVFEDGGKVGIGTEAPAVKLHIIGEESTNSTTGALKITSTNAPSSDQNMVLDGNEINAYSTLAINNNSGNNILMVGGNSGGQVGIGISSSTNLPSTEYKLAVGGKISGNEIRVDFAGIGIPTTTALPNGYQLAVNGKIISTEVKVQAVGNWPDHVFEKDYPLLPLKELEQSIQQNGHLPGIPSAADVKANGGVEVGDMQRRLLEKVEEMTLYIIQLEKRIKELEDKK